jgi:hypothetical protein
VDSSCGGVVGALRGETSDSSGGGVFDLDRGYTPSLTDAGSGEGVGR